VPANFKRPFVYELAKLRTSCIAFALLACTHAASSQQQPAPQAGATISASAADPEIERQLIASTAPNKPLRITFDWSLQEREARFTGKGLARVQGPYHARLDLFGPRGEGYLSAALVDMEMRLPPGVKLGDLPIPPPALYWSALGTFRPPEGATLKATKRDGNNVRLEYAAQNATWTFQFENGVMRRAEVNDSKRGKQTVELTPGAALGLPKQAVYRDWPAFRQLTLTLDQANNVDSFTPETWTPGQR
jgi:hypothetical protein